MKASEQKHLKEMEHWFHHGEGKCLFDAQIEWVDAYLSSKKPSLCSQIGGAPYHWDRYSKDTHVVHVDRRMEYFCLQGHSVCADFFSLPFSDESFDAVFCPHIHEILEDPKQFFNESIRITKTGGSIIIMGLNPKSLWSLQNLLARDNFFPWMIHHWGLQKILNELGGLPVRVEREEFKYFGFYSSGSMMGGVRFKLIEKIMHQHFNQFGALYFVELVKTAYPLDFETSNAI